MYNLKRTNSADKDFQKLVQKLDLDLAIRDGDDHEFYHQFNNIDTIKYAIVAYEDNIAVGCGAIKDYDQTTMEIKRMFVPLEHRGKGIASVILKELENWAVELGFNKCILETGVKQPEAISLYKKNNYEIINNYGQYTGILTSVCFEKDLRPVN